MNGLIDDLRVYNRTLSPEEIEQLYDELKPEDCVPRPEPTVEMDIDKVKIKLKDGKIKIDGYINLDNYEIVANPQVRITVEIQTGGTFEEPEFGVIGEDQIQQHHRYHQPED